MARRDKYGILPPPPVKRGTIVRLRTGQGVATNKRAIVMSNVKADAFSRAYGRQVNVCVLYGKGSRMTPSITEKGAHDLIPVGKVKKIPKVCRDAMKNHKR